MMSEAIARSDVAQIDGLTFSYDPVYISRLTHVAATDGDRTLPGHLAMAKLHATRNDLQAARTCIMGAFSIYGDPDGAAWEAYVLAAIVCRQMDVAEWLLSHRFGGYPAFSLVLGGEDSSSWPINAFRYETITRYTGRFEIHRSIYPSIHAEFLIIRWLSTLPLLERYAKYQNAETGGIVVNVGDVGSKPGLAFSENRAQFFLVPDSEFLRSKGYANVRHHYARNEVAWGNRQPTAFWRGSTTGRPDAPELGWRSLPRIKLCVMAQADTTGLFDVGISKVDLFGGDPGREIPASGLMRSHVPATEFQRYKYQIDIDGHSNSWPGLFLKLLTGSPVLKVASRRGFRQWYYDRLKPWVNFVPVASDMSDLVEKVQWLQIHDDAARRIGERGRMLAESLDYSGELECAGRTISAALRYFAGRPEAVLRFGTAEDDNGYLRDGWSDPEDGGVPAVGWESRLELPRPVAAESFVLTLDLSPCTDLPAPPAQRVAVAVNGEILCEAVLSARQSLRCRVPRRTMETADRLTVTLLHPDATSLASKKHPLDDRALSLVLHGLTLSPRSIDAKTGPASMEVLPPDPMRPTRMPFPEEQLYGPDIWLPPETRLARVKTTWGTVIFADEDCGTLRHGPEASSPRNVMLADNKGTAYLFHIAPDGTRYSVRVTPETQGPGKDAPPGEITARFQAFRVMPVIADERSGFGLQCGGLLLCAEADGRVTLSRKTLGPWERFQLVDTPRSGGER